LIGSCVVISFINRTAYPSVIDVIFLNEYDRRDYYNVHLADNIITQNEISADHSDAHILGDLLGAI